MNNDTWDGYESDKAPCLSTQFTLQETMVLPCSKPDMEEILEIRADARICHCSVVHTKLGRKLVIEGELVQKVVYVAAVPCQSVHSAHSVFPFCTFIELPDDCSPRRFSPHCIQVDIEYLKARQTGPRQISKCAILGVWVDDKPVGPCPDHVFDRNEDRYRIGEPETVYVEPRYRIEAENVGEASHRPYGLPDRDEHLHECPLYSCSPHQRWEPARPGRHDHGVTPCTHVSFCSRDHRGHGK